MLLGCEKIANFRRDEAHLPPAATIHVDHGPPIGRPVAAAPPQEGCWSHCSSHSTHDDCPDRTLTGHRLEHNTIICARATDRATMATAHTERRHPLQPHAHYCTTFAHGFVFRSPTLMPDPS